MVSRSLIPQLCHFLNAIFAIAACLFAARSDAETHQVYGLPIAVREVSKLGDGSQIKVVIGKEARIVERSFLNEFLVRESLFGDSAKPVAPSELFSFIERAHTEKDERLAAFGLAALSSDDLIRCLEQCGAPDMIRDLSREFLNLPDRFVAARSSVDISHILLAAAHGDGTWVRGHASRLLYGQFANST